MGAEAENGGAQGAQDGGQQFSPEDTAAAALGIAQGAQDGGQGEPAEEGGERSEAGGGKEEPTIEERMVQLEADAARRERELYAREAVLKARERELEQLHQLRETATKDPMAALRALGGDPLQIGEQLLGGQEKPKPSPTEQALMQRLEQLESQLQQTTQERARAQETASIRTAIQRSADKYAVLAALAEEGDAVVQDALHRAGQYYQDTGRVPDYGKILADMESEVSDRIFSSISTLARLPSFQERLKGLLEQKTSAPQKTAKGAPGKTLTQDMKSSPNTAKQRMTDEEKEAEAIKFLRAAIPTEG